ncbi:hypothetical protein DYQ86_20610 [Acidobacteria bacterium AB60]|nr:hypothetical protein DYQ86_20610 [Acidobacteria bacterium AB60]
MSLMAQVSVAQFLGRGGSLQYDGALRYDTRRLEYEHQLSGSHLLRWSQQFTGRTWSLLLADEGQLTPSSMGGSLGFGLMGVASPEDLGIPVLDPSVTPDQSVVTSSSQRFTNTAAAEIEYRNSPRMSFTLSGSNGIFRPIDSDLLSGTQFGIQGGYNFAINRRDTAALSIGYELDSIGRMGERVRSYSPGLRYAHREEGRYLIEATGYAQPYEVTASGFHRDAFSWGGDAGLQYRIARNTLQLSVNRSLSLGSGLLSGSRVLMASGALTRPVSRRWQFNLEGVYAKNSGLRGETPFSSQYGGAALQHQLTRTMSVLVHYGLQHGFRSCSSSGCNSAILQNVVTFAFNWTHSPIGTF